MIEIDWRLALAAACCALLAALWLFSTITRRWSAWRRSVLARTRGARAVQGEVDAETLLEEQGYQIVGRQLRRTWTLQCDGEPTEFELRADLLVERDGLQYIAEVKTGNSAPDLRNAATRRQLLEYSLAYQSPIILLVDVESERVQEVRFSPASSRVEVSEVEIAGHAPADAC